MSKHTRRPSAPIPVAEAASRAWDRRLGDVIDGDVPVSAEEWALVETVAALRGESFEESPPPDLVAEVLSMAEGAPAPSRRPSPGTFVSWARRRLHRPPGRRRRVGFIARRSARRRAVSRSGGERRLP